eukprot:TRINITY_DN1302_c0_g1_i11.p1 TRINITY_DN1302_c0_g1~~TRINITY_DN1302_c0_g1_i11.p1  ORF type:complete len:675 (+),score=102.63 TRINITY_DN1302_c0_g1_i11:56-2080(+)
MSVFLDAHAHLFTDAHLDAANFVVRPRAYTLREHLDAILIHAQPHCDEIVVFNAAHGAFPTSKHVLDSFDELVRLQTVYGAQYSKVRCVVGTCRVDEPNAVHLLENPLIVGARMFFKGVAVSDVAAKMAAVGPVIAALTITSKWLEILGSDVDALIAAVEAAPSNVSLMIDHLGAWGTPAMDRYEALLAALSSRTAPVLLKGPGHRTSPFVPITAQYAAAAIRTLGVDKVLLCATDAPHLDSTAIMSAFFQQRGFVAGPLNLMAQVKANLRHLVTTEPFAGSTHAATNQLLKYTPSGLPPCPSGMIHARSPSWYTGEDLMIPVGKQAPPDKNTPAFGWTDGQEVENMHAVLFRPTAAGAVATAAGAASGGCGGLVCIVGSGYTGFLGLYPALLSQELTRRGIISIALEYPCYGASTGRSENDVSVGAQARAWAAAAAFARNTLGFTTVVGAAWGMGAPAMLYASLLPSPATPSPVLFDGVCCLNALLDADIVHANVIESVNGSRAELEASIQGKPFESDVPLPPPTHAEFRKEVSALDDDGLYPGFAGYPLDAKTLEVVIRELYSHEGYSVPKVRGAFLKELAAVAFGKTNLLPGTRALVVHGEQNELHTPKNVEGFVAANKAAVHGGAAILLKGAKHNDFMKFGDSNFEEMLRHVAAFSLDVAGGNPNPVSRL